MAALVRPRLTHRRTDVQMQTPQARSIRRPTPSGDPVDPRPAWFLLAAAGLAGGSAAGRCRVLSRERPAESAGCRARRQCSGAPQARHAGGLQRRPRRPEHEPHLSDDDPHPARDAQHHPDGLRPRRHLLRRGRGLRPARGASGSSAKAWRRSATRSSSHPSSAGTSIWRRASGARGSTAVRSTSSSPSRAC